MVVNTSSGPRYIGPNPHQHVNTSDILEPPQMVYEDEPAEPVHVLNAVGYAAAFADGHHEELLFWVVDDEGEVFGVTLNGEGRADLASVEGREGFVRYERINELQKEN